jgi:hypothetical protein
MGLQYKRKSKLGLDRLPVLIQDTSLDSKGYFNITEFPSYFGNGKNLIRLKGNSGNLVPGSPIYVEILDVNGNSVYHELPNYSEPDLTRYISVWVYNDVNGSFNTPNGLGKVIICGTAQQTVDGRPIPNEWKNKVNIRWVREIPITRETKSPSKIIFLGNELPKVKLEEVTNYYKKVELLSESILLTTQSFRDTGSNDLSPILVSYDYNAGLGTTGNVRTNTYSPYQTNFPKLTFRKRALVNNTASLVFAQNLVGKMTGGTIEINLSQSTTAYNSLKPDSLPEYITKPVSFTASILSVDDYSTLSISYPLTASNYVGGEERNRIYFTEFKDAEWVIRYVSTGSYTDSPFENPTVLVTVDGINPLGGNVDRIKVYYRPSFNVSDYEFGGSTTLFSNEESVSFYANVKNFRRNTAYDFKVEFENIEEDISDSNVLVYDFLVEEAIMGSPAPPDKSIQYNNSDAFEGSYDLAYDYNYENVGIGTYDPTTKLQIFNELGFNVDGTVFTLLQSGSNHIYVGGQFERYLGRSYNGIIRLNLSGSIDTGFNPGKGFNGPVRAIQFVSGSSDIYVGGEFTQYSGSKDVKYFVRLKSNGTISSNFKEHGELDGRVNAIYVSTETGNSGSVYLGGAFTQYSGSAGRILKVNSTGSVIKSFTGRFDTGSNTEIFAIAGYNPNSHLYVGGTFTSYSGSSDYQYGNGGILKINNNGSVITTFNQSSSINGGTSGSAVYTIYNPYFSVGGTEWLYIGGNFTKYSGSVEYKMTSLDPTNGSIRTNWNQNDAFWNLIKDRPNNSIRTIHFIGNSTANLLVGGSFATGTDFSFTPPAKNLVVMDFNGGLGNDYIRSLFPSPTQAGDNTVFASIKLSDSASIIGGSFSKYRVGGTPEATTTGKLVNSDKIIIIETPSLAPYTSSYSGFFDFRNRDRDAFFISSSIGTFIGSQSVLWPQVSDNPFVIKNSGDVGIGTSNPQQKIHIEGGVIARLPNVQQPWVILYNSESGVFTYGTASAQTSSIPPDFNISCHSITANQFNACRFPNEIDEYDLTFGFTLSPQPTPIPNITVISASLFSGSSQIWTTGSQIFSSPISLPITWTIPTSSIGNVTYRFIVTASYASEATNPAAWRTLECGPTSFTITPPSNLNINCELIQDGFLPTRHNREPDDYNLVARFRATSNPWTNANTDCTTRQLNITLISASLFSGSSKIWETGSLNYLNINASAILPIITLPTQSFGNVTHILRVTASLSESRFNSSTWASCSTQLLLNVSERPCPNSPTLTNYNTNFQLGTPPFELLGNIRYIAVELGLSGSVSVTASIVNTDQSAWPTNQTGYQFINLSPWTRQYRKDNNSTTSVQRNFNTIAGTQYRYFLNLVDSFTGSLGNTQTDYLNIPIDTTHPYNPTAPTATSTNRSYLKILISSSYSSSANSNNIPYFNLNQPPKICNDFTETININKTISLRWGVLPGTSNVSDAITQYFTEESLLDVKRWDIRLGGHPDITGSIFYNPVNWNYSGAGDSTTGYASTSNSDRGKIVYIYNEANPTYGISTVSNRKFYFSGITPYLNNNYSDNLRVFWPDFRGRSKWLYIIVNENIDLQNSWQSGGTDNTAAWTVSGYTGIVSPFKYYIFQNTQTQQQNQPGMFFNYYLKFH